MTANDQLFCYDSNWPKNWVKGFIWAEGNYFLLLLIKYLSVESEQMMSEKLQSCLEGLQIKRKIIY